MEKEGDKLMRKSYLMRGVFLLVLKLITFSVFAQDSTWTLERSIAYATANNLSIQQNVLNERVVKMQWEQSKLTVLPKLSLSSSYGRNFGRSIDPTTNTFNATTYDFTGLSGSASVLLFGWFRTKNTITKNAFIYKAAEADLHQLQNDLRLNVATGYLRILLAKETVNICLNQIDISMKQVKQTEMLLQAGLSNGLDLAQVKTQLITDSTNYFKTELALQQSKIDFKALLNLEFTAPFDALPINDQDLQQAILATLAIQPIEIYNEAVQRVGSIKSNELKIQSARTDLAITKSNLYPQLNFSASSGTNYSSSYIENLPDGQTRSMPVGKQFQNNFSQSIYMGVSIPIFNALLSRYAIKQSKISLQNSVLKSEEAKLKLKQEIYNACSEVSIAFQTYRAGKSAADMTQIGLDFAQKRYEKGLIPAIDLLLAQNTAFKTNADLASTKYDLVFKLMVIDYYLGKGSLNKRFPKFVPS